MHGTQRNGTERNRTEREATKNLMLRKRMDQSNLNLLRSVWFDGSESLIQKVLQFSDHNGCKHKLSSMYKGDSFSFRLVSIIE
ncbi:hypothetical protein L1987_09983 [Smallanthus sonchifolius]|uniref:Uncharacterized protein n=1 Tax=Smallanthus sonchifolius TaxID=185202 RepID=A0ACB9JR56_9ASTR|nr:hypothetical protein L1987_09983 [Smallanthus sonchifolius]